jgi:protein SCO1/2
MRRLLACGFLAWTLSLATPSAAQSMAGTVPAPPASSAQVGVDEKLGTQVPMDLVLNDEDGHPVRLGSLIDRPTLLTLNYFRCAGICTPQLNGMAQLINQIGNTPGKDFQVVTVSFDPSDTPEVAKTKQDNYLREISRPFSAARWRFLTGPGAATRSLCDAVGFHFHAQGDGFIHSGVIMALSPQGKVTRYLYGTTFLPADVQMAVAEAGRGETRPTVNRLLEMCFRYDPSSQSQVFAFTRVAALAVFLAGGVFLFLLLRRRGHKEAKP